MELVEPEESREQMELVEPMEHVEQVKLVEPNGAGGATGTDGASGS